MAPRSSGRGAAGFRVCGSEVALSTITSRVTVSEGLHTLFDKDGSAFIIHELADKYLPDPPTKDAPVWPRIACGVIVKQ